MSGHAAKSLITKATLQKSVDLANVLIESSAGAEPLGTILAGKSKQNIGLKNLISMPEFGILIGRVRIHHVSKHLGFGHRMIFTSGIPTNETSLIMLSVGGTLGAEMVSFRSGWR